MEYVHYLRSRVGPRPVFLAFASIILFNERGSILLQRRGDSGRWGLPGGVLELGEDILSCARRELSEETGLQAGNLNLVGVYSEPHYAAAYPNGDQVQQFTVCFAGQLTGGDLRIDGRETLALEFVSPLRIDAYQMDVWYRDMVKDYLTGQLPAFKPPCQVDLREPQIETVRGLIGHNPYLGVGATAVTRRADGKLLLARRMDNAQWYFPGGFMDLGENAAQAAVREAREETGLAVKPERLLGIFSPPVLWQYPNGDRTQSLVAVFLCRPAGGSPAPDREEVDEIAWLTPAEVARLPQHDLLTPFHQAILAHLDEGSFVL